MNSNQFQYVMPDDDEEDDYPGEEGNEMVDMEDDEAQIENDKPVGMHGEASDEDDQDENRQPFNKQDQQRQQSASMNQKVSQENVYKQAQAVADVN